MTNIAKSIDLTAMDMSAFGRMQPVQELHCSAATGQGLSTPDEQARVLVFLMSDMSSFISGAIVPVDRGWCTL